MQFGSFLCVRHIFKMQVGYSGENECNVLQVAMVESKPKYAQGLRETSNQANQTPTENSRLELMTLATAPK